MSDATRFPGRRWFIAGSVIMIALALTHTAAVVQAVLGPPDPSVAELEKSMRAATQIMGPMTFSVWGLMTILSVSYSAMTLAIGVMNLVCLAPMAAAGKVGRLTLINVLLSGVMAGVCLACQFPPPLVFTAAATVCFAVSAQRQGRAMR